MRQPNNFITVYPRFLSLALALSLSLSLSVSLSVHVCVCVCECGNLTISSLLIISRNTHTRAHAVRQPSSFGDITTAPPTPVATPPVTSASATPATPNSLTPLIAGTNHHFKRSPRVLMYMNVHM